MIERMSKVTVFSESSKKGELLVSLRNFGVMHISDLVERSEKVDKLEKTSERYSKMISLIEEKNGKELKTIKQIPLSGSEFDSVIQGLESAVDETSRLENEIHELTIEKERIAPFGEFEIEDLNYLEANGIKFNFFILSKKDLSKLSKIEDFNYIHLLYGGKQCAIATLEKEMPSGIQAIAFEKPKKSLSEIDAMLLADREKIKALSSKFIDAGAYVSAIKERIEIDSEKIIYEKVSATVQDEAEIIYISGYIPNESNDDFKLFCKENNIGYLLTEPDENDNPPTKVKRKGFVKFIGPVFDMLNLVPGYNEPDISLWFELFLTLFFAMIVGDAGYGLLFLIIAIIMNVKSRKCTSLNSLVYIFSGATIIWGALTGTWFGSEAILTKFSFLQFFVIPEITNFPNVMGVDADYAQNMMMKFCFMIGTIHISLACLINIFRKIPQKDLSFVSDIGWLVDTCLLYLLVLYLVIGETAPLALIAIGVGIGFVLVCCFGSQAPGVPFVKGLKASLGGFFTNFLDTVSCFSNIMSYIRLFAVGMASLAIAQSFNDMAAPMLQGLALPAGILIIVVGHLINIVMGLLSVVVHGVRLNVLEFSNQLGMEWSGYNYDPFRKKNHIDNAV